MQITFFHTPVSCDAKKCPCRSKVLHPAYIGLEGFCSIKSVYIAWQAARIDQGDTMYANWSIPLVPNGDRHPQVGTRKKAVNFIYSTWFGLVQKIFCTFDHGNFMPTSDCLTVKQSVSMLHFRILEMPTSDCLTDKQDVSMTLFWI